MLLFKEKHIDGFKDILDTLFSAKFHSIWPLSHFLFPYWNYHVDLEFPYSTFLDFNLDTSCVPKDEVYLPFLSTDSHISVLSANGEVLLPNPHRFDELWFRVHEVKCRQTAIPSRVVRTENDYRDMRQRMKQDRRSFWESNRNPDGNHYSRGKMRALLRFRMNFIGDSREEAQDFVLKSYVDWKTRGCSKASPVLGPGTITPSFDPISFHLDHSISVLTNDFFAGLSL